ncbi:AMP-binding protein [Amycolatopsis sp.]|jgi:crotonobetaine/carnitine-CoA ligase|uniref:AMP-binding protein n=1 Tax=Amycolatopsis sp. TaxID=37632 RepID=UPI00260DFC9A|nr:AMP-binding protein [Amycolatopsis sp.]
MDSPIMSTTTLPRVLRDRVASAPEQVALIDAPTGLSVTFAEFGANVQTWARRMAAHGVVAGDHVATLLGPTFDAYYVWISLSGLGAVEVPINPQLKGRLLTYLLNHAEPRILVTQSAFLENLLSIADGLDTLEQIVVIDAAEGIEQTAGGLRVLSNPEFAAREIDVEFQYAERHDTACIIYTSGTTGPPKGVVIPWGMQATSIKRLPERIRGGSRYSFLSPAHLSGKSALTSALTEERTLVLRETFSVSAFWEDIARYDCRVTQLFPAMIKYLLSQPPVDADAKSPLQFMWTAPVTKDTKEFMRRFGVAVSTGFGMTEIGGPIYGVDIDGTNLESCGGLNAADPRGYEVRLVDEHDREVEVGDVGELAVRTSVPWSLNAGYFRNPEATAAAWHNGWFHTGDALRQDSDGNFYFVDRFKDCIRRKGENISSFEVEAYALEVAGIAEAAAVGVPAEDGEQDVKIFLVASPGVSLNLAAVGLSLAQSMPRFMIPRFLEQVNALPRTPTTGRAQKGSLRSKPPGARSWDRLAGSVPVPVRFQQEAGGR